MTVLQSWLAKPIASVRINTCNWSSWIKVVRQLSPARRKPSRPRLEVLDRLALGGKKSLLLVSIEGRRLLVGVGDGGAPSVTRLGERRGLPRPGATFRGTRSRRARSKVGL